MTGGLDDRWVPPRRRARVVAPVFVSTIGLAVLLTSDIGTPEIAVRLWFAALATIAGNWLLTWYDLVPTGARADAFDRACAPRPEVVANPPRGLVETRRLLGSAGAGAGEMHFRVRPVLRTVAAQRLAGHGLDLDDPASEAEISRRCGPALWDLVRPDRPAPDDRGAPGPDRAGVVALVDALEAL